MSNVSKLKGNRYDIVERYCPKCKENVVMRRVHGTKTVLKCMNYENCKEQKDSFCGNDKNIIL